VVTVCSRINRGAAAESFAAPRLNQEDAHLRFIEISPEGRFSHAGSGSLNGRTLAQGSSVRAFIVHPDTPNTWKARPGYRILIMDCGAVRFDFPNDWLARVDSEYVRIIDREPPNDRCGLMVSSRQLSLRMADFPIRQLLQEVTNSHSVERPIVYRESVICHFRPPLEAAWRQMRFVDPFRRREACTRVCLARGGRTLATVVFDFWPEDEKRLHEPWTTFLDTLAVGDYLEDPITGRRRERRG
jgi:hypothetical protein